MAFAGAFETAYNSGGWASMQLKGKKRRPLTVSLPETCVASLTEPDLTAGGAKQHMTYGGPAMATVKKASEQEVGITHHKPARCRENATDGDKEHEAEPHSAPQWDHLVKGWPAGLAQQAGSEPQRIIKQAREVV
ncbi:hypothetical protein NDU88_008968 [Pleurodeles waltl]|uniref:Uncharacterized protein n=1 Tax=Pleurodeles waltl TaxID=8319 RepID=A0AAV7QWB7_PLEWA|nr:hypothetical protein NDU88_008968 [Pleurodeles waltl]